MQLNDMKAVKTHFKTLDNKKWVVTVQHKGWKQPFAFFFKTLEDAETFIGQQLQDTSVEKVVHLVKIKRSMTAKPRPDFVFETVGEYQ